MSDRPGNWVEGAFEIGGLVAFFGILAGIGTFGYQCLTWLKTGEWPWLPVGDFVPVDPSVIEWVGVRKIAAYALATPLSGALLVGPALAYYATLFAVIFLLSALQDTN